MITPNKSLLNFIPYNTFPQINQIFVSNPGKFETKSTKDNLNNEIIRQIKEEPAIPAPVQALFLILPKAERHAHIGGCRPIPDFKNTQPIPDHTNNLTEFMHVYDLVSNGYKDSPEQLKLDTYQICKNAAEDNVKYLSLRISLTDAPISPEQVLIQSKKELSLLRIKIVK